MDIFIVLLVYKFIKGTFTYEKVTRFELVIIPVYSAVMMILGLKNVHSLTSAGLAIALVLIGVAIGFLQAGRTQVRDTNKLDSHQRPILEVKRNWPYLLGWLASFAIGIGVEVFYGVRLSVDEVSQELFTEILKDLSVVAMLRGHSTWYVWILNVATSFTYGGCLLARYPKIRSAIRSRHHH